jgi:hypothetical protein
MPHVLYPSEVIPMSFSSETKEELCRTGLSRSCCALAEAYGVLLYCHTFDRREIRIITASDAFAQRLPRLFRRAFDAAFDVLPPREGAASAPFSSPTAPGSSRSCPPSVRRAA